MRKGMLPELGWLFTVLQSQDMNPNQADFKIHANPTAPPMSLCRTLIYIPWDFLNSLLLAFLVKNLPVFLLPCSLKKKNLLIILHSWNLSTYLTRETQELKGMECGNSELKASSRLFLILFPLGWTCSYSAWQPSFSLHIPPPLQSSVWPEHSIVSAPFPLENVESALTLTPIRELCSCCHAARPKTFRKLFAFRRLLYAWQLCKAWHPRTAPGLGVLLCFYSSFLLLWFPEGPVNWEFTAKKERYFPPAI